MGRLVQWRIRVVTPSGLEATDVEPHYIYSKAQRSAKTYSRTHREIIVIVEPDPDTLAHYSGEERRALEAKTEAYCAGRLAGVETWQQVTRALGA